MFGEGLTAVSQSNQAVHEFRARVYDIMKSNLACSGVDWRATLDEDGHYVFAILNLLRIDGHL
jgi:hypothetical protein